MIARIVVGLTVLFTACTGGGDGDRADPGSAMNDTCFNMPAAPTSAQEIRVVDGDTVDIDGVRHRLAGIDAPERHQTCVDADGAVWACGRAATQALADLIGDGPVFEKLFERPHTIEKYRSAPLYKDRLRYLGCVADGGAAPRTLYKIAYCQLNLVGLLDLPTGDGDALAGTGGLSAALWAETSGTLAGPDWLYGAAAGALAARPLPAMSGFGRRFVGFARLGITWRPLDDLALSVQAEIASPACRSALASLGGPSILFGMGGWLRLTELATLEIAVTEDDGRRRAVPDIGLHAAIRWLP